jgi:hypothetical protein
MSAKVDKRDELIARLHGALKRISAYQSVETLRRHSRRDYGLDAEEAIEMAYENVIFEAKAAIKGVRRPQQKGRP